jgi:hypothetical protein
MRTLAFLVEVSVGCSITSALLTLRGVERSGQDLSIKFHTRPYVVPERCNWFRSTASPCADVVVLYRSDFLSASCRE